MKRFLLFLLLVGLGTSVWSQRVTLSLQDETLASALRQIDHAQQEKRILFVFNDLDSIRVTRNLFHRTALEAVNEVCEGYPILVTECDADILVEYIRPPVHLLPNTTISLRQLHYDAEGYAIRPGKFGMTGRQLLLLLPHLTALDDEALCINGQAVKEYYLNGQRLADAHELLSIPSDMIAEVRVNERTQAIYVTLRQPSEDGYYGSLMAKTDFYQSSAEHELGGVWFARYGQTQLYNRFDVAANDLSHAIKQQGFMSIMQDSRLMTLEHSFSDRLSITHEFSPRQALGLSYYIASHRGQAKVRHDDASGFIDFNGSNRHTDQELTLRYNAKIGSRDTRLEAVADYYSRQTSSEHVSLYGAGVGTELGEAPSISMWKAAAEIHHTFSPHFSLHFGTDLRYFFSHYDPKLYLSNFEGSPAFLHEMNQHGLMLKKSLGFSIRWQQLRLETGAALQHQIAMQEILDHDDNGHDYAKGGIYPYLQLYYPVGPHRLSFSYQRDLADIPYAAMSPAVRWSDAFNYSTGNRKLHAPEAHRLMLHASGWDDRLCVTASYLQMHNEIFWQSAISSGQTDVFYTQPVNLSSSRLWLLQAEANLHPIRSWQVKLNALWQWRPEDNTIGDTHYRAHHLRSLYSCHNIIDLRQGWTMSLNAAFAPTYHVFDRTYHSRHSLRGELQRGFFAERLRCALTFQVWESNRRLDRKIGTALVSYHETTDQTHIGLRMTWKFDGGHRVKVDAVEGAQHYNDIRDN